MVATVGSISIDLSTNAAKFASGFRSSATTVEREAARMSKGINGFEQSLARAGGRFKSFASGFAGGVLAGLGVDSIVSALGRAREAISQFDEIAARSRTVGLKTDTFQALGFAAKQANIEQESLNTSLEIFAKNVGLAERGTGALFSGLQKLNPELLRSILNAKDQESRLKLVADALNRTKDATQQAALATAVFGRSGIDMARLLDQGGQSIEKMKENAKELGIIVPDDLLQRAEKLDDQLDTLATVIDVNLNEALAEMGPLLVKGSEGLAAMAKGASAFARAIADADTEQPKFVGLLGAIAQKGLTKALADAANNVGTFDDDLRNAFTGTAGSVQELAKQIVDVEQQIAATKKSLAEFKEVGAEGFEVDIAKENLRSLEAQLETLKRKAAEAKPVSLDTSTAMGKLAALTAAAAVAGAAINAALRSGASGTTGTLPTVTRHTVGTGTTGTVSDDIDAIVDQNTTTTGPTLHQISVDDYLAGRRASGGPVKPYLTGENGPELFFPQAAGNISSATQTDGMFYAGAGHLENIDDQTFAALDELKSFRGYLETISDGQEASQKALEGIRDAIDDLESAASRSYSTGSGGGYTSGGGGFSGGGGGGAYSSGDARSPYYYNSSYGRPGGAQYNPVADFLYNGNYGALSGVADTPYSFYEATPTTSPFDVDRNHFQTNADIADMLRKQGPQIGGYGGGDTFSGQTDKGGPGSFFGGGSRLQYGDEMLAAYFAAMEKDKSAAVGFATGGMIHGGDSQHVEFYKNPNEDVEILKPGQQSRRGGTTVGDIHIHVNGDIGNRQSQLAMRDELYRGVLSALNRP